jgi:putative N6-adenine-specific DNA methylase
MMKAAQEMKGIIVINKGFESVCADEIKEILGKKTKTENKSGFVIFDFKDFEEIFTLCYKSQSASQIFLLLDQFPLADSATALAKLDLSAWLKSNFSVQCIKYDEELSSQEIIQDFAAEIAKKTGANAVYNNSETNFVALADGKSVYFGVDFSGDDLGRRDYRIFVGNKSLKGNVAYSLIRLAGFDSKKSLFDPFCGSGEIPIEAALSATGFAIRNYGKEKFPFRKLQKFKEFDFDSFFSKIDKQAKLDAKTNITALDRNFKFVNQSQKNAKIAGIVKKIDFSRLELEWLDTKFKKESVDCFVTIPIQPSKSMNPDFVEKIYKEIFFQLEFVLTKEGKAVFAIRKGPAIELLKKHAEANKAKKFAVSEEREFWVGKEEWTAISFVK